MYRLAYPENYGEKREPIQVIATTHSPYLLDLYKDYPEEIVIASKDENGVHFERLIDNRILKRLFKTRRLAKFGIQAFSEACLLNHENYDFSANLPTMKPL